MDEVERKQDPSLPANYVSLAQLQERWIQKQEELKLKKKEEEEKKERDAGTRNGNQNQRGLENDLREKMEGLSVRDVPRRKGEIDGRKMGVIEDKGKGKEKVIDGLQGGDEPKKKKKKRNLKKKKSGADEEMEKIRSEIKEVDGGNGREGVEIVPGNEVKVGSEMVLSEESGVIDGGLKGSVSVAEVLPRNGVRREVPDVKTKDFRSAFRRNGYGSGYRSKKEHSIRNELEVKLDLDKKMEGEKGYGKKWRERRRNGEYREDSRQKENRTDVLKGNEAEPELENQPEEEVLDICSEIGGLNGGNKNDDRVELEKKVDEEVLVVESAKSVENRRFGNGYRRNGNSRENRGRRFGGFSFNDRNNVRSRMEGSVGDGRRYTRFGSFGDRRKMKQTESGMVWVKKEEKKGADAAEVGSSGIPADQV